jgi:hypothetical protein
LIALKSVALSVPSAIELFVRRVSKRYSRIKQVVTGVQNRMSRQSENEDTVVESIDVGVKANGNGSWSINKAIVWLQLSGDLPSNTR